MQDVNPARSGDAKPICWMTKGGDDFYYKVYRSCEAWIWIIDKALENDEGLRNRAVSASKPNRWLRNVRTYLAALDDGRISEIEIKQLLVDKPLYDLADVVELAADGFDDVQRHDQEDVSELKAADEPNADYGSDSESDSNDPGKYIIYPRSKRVFYKKVLRGMRLRMRPPEKFCLTCEKSVVKEKELDDLRAVFFCPESSPDYHRSQVRISELGGRQKVSELLRKCEIELVKYKRHVTWLQEQRAYRYKRTAEMDEDTATLELDYGGMTDSAGRKVNVWSATFIMNGRDQEHIDFFFEAGNQRLADGRTGARKTAVTGIYCLEQLLDPEKAPRECSGKSVLAHYFPSLKRLIFSGDTGNGYRSYEMIEFFSTVFNKYGYEVELIPLAPGHAFNRTDGRLAHMNIFL